MNKEGEGYGNNFIYNLSTTQLFLYLYMPPTKVIFYQWFKGLHAQRFVSCEQDITA